MKPQDRQWAAAELGHQAAVLQEQWRKWIREHMGPQATASVILTLVVQPDVEVAGVQVVYATELSVEQELKMVQGRLQQLRSRVKRARKGGRDAAPN